MPKKCQRPPSSQRESQRSATSPARNAHTMPSKLGPNELHASTAASASCRALSSRHTSLTTTAGVRMTAKAKLNSSTRAFTPPRSRPVDIVAPERENPRKGRHRPWTAPIQADSRAPIRDFGPLHAGSARRQ